MKTKRVRLRLWVSGERAEDRQLGAELRRMCEERLRGDWQLEVVDAADGDIEGEEVVLVTPMIERREPGPMRRVVGDLRDVESVLDILEVADVRREEVEAERRTSDVEA